MKNNLNNFNDIEDSYLRAYNRLAVSFNLTQEGNREQSLAYLKQFSQEDRVAIATVTLDLEEKGWKQMKIDMQNRVAGDYSEVEESDEGVALEFAV